MECRIVTPTGVNPENHEIEIAIILMKYFKKDVEFLRPIDGFKIKTPDAVIDGVLWEFKSPIGNSKKSTIQAQFRGLKQSRNIVIDSRRTKLDDEIIIQRIKQEMTEHRKVGNVLLITKSSVVIEF